MANILCSPSNFVLCSGEMNKLGDFALKYG